MQWPNGKGQRTTDKQYYSAEPIIVQSILKTSCHKKYFLFFFILVKILKLCRI